MNLRQVHIKDFALKAFLAFMVLCPMYYYNSLDFGVASLRIGQEQFFQLGATVMFGLVLLENMWLALFLIWTVFLYSYYGFSPMGGNYVLNVFWGCVLYQVVYKLVNRHNVKLVFNAMMTVYIFNLIFVVFQLLRSDPLFTSETQGFYFGDPVGIFGLKAFMGMYVALCTPIILMWKGFFKYLVLAVSCWLIYLSQCSVGAIALLTSILWHTWFHSKRLFIALTLIGSLICGAYVYKDSKMNFMSDRWDVWKVSMQDAVIHPILGCGLDSFRNMSKTKPFMYFKNTITNKSERFHYHQDTNRIVAPEGFAKPDQACDPWDHPHNEYVSIFYEFGIIPFIILGMLVWDMRRRFDKFTEMNVAMIGCFIAFAVFSIGQFPFHVARIGYLAPILLAIYFKLTEPEVI